MFEMLMNFVKFELEMHLKNDHAHASLILLNISKKYL